MIGVTVAFSAATKLLFHDLVLFCFVSLEKGGRFYIWYWKRGDGYYGSLMACDVLLM
jgi:hypothetical protein